ncbi:exodeoxyribonuclease VII large subunit [Macrococcoides canis]|uniref:exodeoxyribonuclease VII large subunit n=1 Tax=Macrococcoides canis TaxID=1855823 RepID=UPI00207C9719|nr:exodeoxyribonuclease VII large subunit [Macrococcus canis]MCO4095535.1 exodeoxyribonuclease VII large subunit [Macrococcus canis]UTH08255.1 exodeoxyribonuclease VII large subunit [Macrococcus canis]
MEKYLSVSALTKYIKTKFDKDPYLSNVYIKGELSNFKRHSSGHLYFALKDNGGVISCMMFKRDAAQLTFSPKEGDSVLITGRISVYESRGNYQLYANDIRLDGIGILYERLEALKKAYFDKGYFDAGHKKQLPKYPEHIAVLTASTGAAVQDIRTTLSRRYPLAEVTYISTIVQGEAAKDDIVKNLRTADQLDADVIIVGRGGGSIEDLWAFNEEVVVEAIYACNTPVISAVGHETDTTLSDLVADHRAPTPTAAAVMATPDSKELLLGLKQVDITMMRSMNLKLKHSNERLNYLSSYYIFKNPHMLVEQKMQKLDEFEQRIKQSSFNLFNQSKMNFQFMSNKLDAQKLNTKLKYQHEQIHSMQNVMHRTLSYKLSNYHQQLKHRIALLSSLSPTETLLRGYAIVRSEDKIIKSVDDVKEQDYVHIQLNDGQIEAQVKHINK